MCEIFEEKIMEILTLPISLSPPHLLIWQQTHGPLGFISLGVVQGKMSKRTITYPGSNFVCTAFIFSRWCNTNHWRITIMMAVGETCLRQWGQPGSERTSVLPQHSLFWSEQTRQSRRGLRSCSMPVTGSPCELAWWRMHGTFRVHSVHSRRFNILTEVGISELLRLLMETVQMSLTISWVPLNLYGLRLHNGFKTMLIPNRSFF